MSHAEPPSPDALGSGGAGAALLAGCGGAPTAGDEPRPAAQLGPLTIDVVTRSPVASATGHSQWYDHAAKTTFAPETGVTVNLIDGLPSVTEKLTVMAAAGTPPDGSWFPTMSDGSGGRELAQKGVFKPLDDLIKRDARFDLKPYFPTLLELCRFGGKTFGLTTMSHYGTNVLYYNRARWQGAGVTIPADGSMTVDEFVAAGQKVVNKAQDRWAYWPVLGMDQWGVFWIRQFGGEVLDEAGKRVLLDSPEARAGLEWVYHCQAKFQLIDDLYRSDSQSTMFESSGTLAAISQTPGLVSEYKKPGQERVKFDLGIAVFPRGPKGHGTQGLGAGMGMTRLEHQAAVWEWVKFITNKENGVAQVFGGAGSPGGRVELLDRPPAGRRRPHLRHPAEGAPPRPRPHPLAGQQPAGRPDQGPGRHPHPLLQGPDEPQRRHRQGRRRRQRRLEPVAVAEGVP